METRIGARIVYTEVSFASRKLLAIYRISCFCISAARVANLTNLQYSEEFFQGVVLEPKT